ncbi:hypothetical protein DK842_17980 [Chromobacterium phragmitis]|uniref:hypothetical protein n=1 Tax=Chromobacterium phragmitis TaxID=2202141 RepID=UPI000DEC9C1A|nr:hypothetical protein [Chromobacterium phragmitis]AXE31621.1 hypothetical protein DK842_17980 [Chromobacterium phragmitis]
MPTQIDFLSPIKQAIAQLHGFLVVLLLAGAVTVLAAVATNLYLTLYTGMSRRERKRYCRIAGQVAGTIALLLGAMSLMR